MDWTFWVGLAAIAAIWAATQWAVSFRRQSERRRGVSREEADALADVERQRAQGRFWRKF